MVVGGADRGCLVGGGGGRSRGRAAKIEAMVVAEAVGTGEKRKIAAAAALAATSPLRGGAERKPSKASTGARAGGLAAQPDISRKKLWAFETHASFPTE
ncbi:hypothetical protein E2562_036927 [Oryza meyeriana var. granulata]|uniref:Uncharacterized protein n=1 Tax=Oryza meyeriana var. granulata TaxID=110450 RepID=A0A6G1FG84_9ORYZ|nr:hypothetical protein E2562_036927 [Oryza meyeriana var. granulata]